MKIIIIHLKIGDTTMKLYRITYIEKNTYAEGLEQTVHRYAETAEDASKSFQTEEMGICERVVSVEEV